ncbi:MAG: hypothetical protein HUK09_01755 [Bacteroidaceae bacterium]|nr:hypothetical protein [Bacteroidaceae bacterium]
MQLTVYTKMALSTLLGIVLPFGNFWGPFLVRPKSERHFRFRKRLMLAALAHFLVCVAAAFWRAGTPTDTGSCAFDFTVDAWDFLLYVGGIVLIAVCFACAAPKDE